MASSSVLVLFGLFVIANTQMQPDDLRDALSEHDSSVQCRIGSISPLVLDKAAAYPSLRVDLENMRRDWLNTTKFPAVQFSNAESAFWESLKQVPNAVRKKRQIDSNGFTCIRKEYRQLTYSERTALHAAFNQLKVTPIPGGTEPEYDVLVKMHRYIEAPGAHRGPAFLPWHREYLLRMERALRRHNPSVCLPYWDSTLDQHLPTPSDSAIWTSSYLGSNRGVVSSGFAGGWSVIQECGRQLTRDMRIGSGKNYLYSDSDISWVLGQSNLDSISVPNPGSKFEYDHGAVHVFVGGHMGSISCAPSDPVFWMHHAFVDCTWERFRTRPNYPSPGPELDYPSTGNPTNQGPFDPMQPFDGLVNMHGLSNSYTNIDYNCAPPPQSCSSNADCNSSLLWCDGCQCKAKIKLGGDCTGFVGKPGCTGSCGLPFRGWLRRPGCSRSCSYWRCGPPTCKCENWIKVATPGPTALATPGPAALATPGPAALATPGPAALATPRPVVPRPPMPYPP